MMSKRRLFKSQKSLSQKSVFIRSRNSINCLNETINYVENMSTMATFELVFNLVRRFDERLYQKSRTRQKKTS